MRLTQFTDYGLRVLMHLALVEGDRVTIAEIAERFDISRTHLMKVVPELVRHGWVTSERGRSGGLALAKPAADISIGAVVRSLEGEPELVACQQPGGSCVISPACGLPGIFTHAAAAFYEALDGHTLADIVSARRPLRKLLRIQAA